MTRARVPETDEGIQGGVTVEIYDQMQRQLRDKGWIETNDIIKSGLSSGLALEIGPGPGYLGRVLSAAVRDERGGVELGSGPSNTSNRSKPVHGTTRAIGEVRCGFGRGSGTNRALA